jgi:hypothetical protein
LWQKRNDYQPRQAAGVTYYVRSQGDRQVAFAASGDYLLLSTREDLMGRTLTLMNASAGAATPAVTSDAWFNQAIAAAGQPGDLRLVTDLQTLARAPQFRSYWIQNNVSELRAYRAAVSDLRRASGQMREERVMVRMEAADAQSPLSAGIAGMIPDGTGLYRIWSSPPAEMVVAALRQKVLAPGLSRPIIEQRDAPQAILGNGETGSVDDLETRIDEAALLATTAGFDERPLRKLLAASTPRSMLVAQTARDISGGIFEGTRSVVIVEADSWDAAAVRDALGAGASVRGRFLIAGEAGTAGTSPALGAGVVYAAGFAHAQERIGYLKMLRLMDQVPAWMSQGNPDQARPPLFFAENLASLSSTLQRLTNVSVVVRDTGSALQQTVVYRMSP